MRDYNFGTYLYNLRTLSGLSQSQLGNLLEVSNKAVSKWETGQAKPALKQLTKLSKIFNVSIEQLIEQINSEEKDIKKIVITGGPCAGKSTALSWIQEEYTKKGYSVLVIPESATELILGGISPSTMSSTVQFQLAILRNQIAKEQLFEESAKKLKNSNKVLIICDRGSLDGKAYTTELEFRQLLSLTGYNEVQLRDKYDAVFHLVTAAKGAEEFYTTENNKARRESLDEARHADERTLSSWVGHPHLRVIENNTDFHTKMKTLLREISSFLGEPEPNEIERKFLIEMPNFENIKNQTIAKLEIVQTYLNCYSDNEEVRIRQRGDGNHFVYTKTIKRKVSELTRIEIEKQISQEEYLSLLLDADQERRQLRKTRYCIVYKSQYLEIDIYPFWQDKAILEIELGNESQEISIPPYIKVIKEVTSDDAFKNYNLAKQYK